MAVFQNTIDILGDDNTVTQLVSKSLVEFNDNVLHTLGQHAFGGSGSDYANFTLQKVRVPNVTACGKNAFSNCSALSLIDIGITKIDASFSAATSSCNKLSVLILRSTSVCTLTHLNYLPSSLKSNGTVFVPQNLLTEYQNATNWASLYSGGNCNFVAIEGSEHEYD